MNQYLCLSTTQFIDPSQSVRCNVKSNRHRRHVSERIKKQIVRLVIKKGENTTKKIPSPGEIASKVVIVVVGVVLLDKPNNKFKKREKRNPLPSPRDVVTKVDMVSSTRSLAVFRCKHLIRIITNSRRQIYFKVRQCLTSYSIAPPKR